MQATKMTTLRHDSSGGHDAVVTLTILIVEDDATFRAYTQLMLRQMTGVRCEVDCVGSIAEAHAHLDHHAADLILLDLALPNADNPDAYRGLRELSQRQPATPVVVLTAHPGQSGVEAVRQGAQELLDKRAITPSILERSIRHAVERHLQSNRLVMQSEQLRDAIVHLERFGAMVAHDLKSPLTAISLALSTLSMLERDLCDQSQSLIESATSRVRSLAQHMDGLLAEVSDVTGDLEGRSQIDVIEVIAWIKELLEPDLSNVRIDAVDVVPLWGQPTLIRQLLKNLIANAVRHNPDRQLTVRVSTQVSPGGTRLRVEDSGRGIAPELRDTLFTPQTPGSTLAIGHAIGHAIGLASCRMAVNRHGGRIWVEDSALGGAAIVAEIPQRNRCRDDG